jgi:hypothetical protein
MGHRLLCALALAVVAGACTQDHRPAPVAPSPRAETKPDDQVVRRIEIYSAVIRHLVTRDHTFGGGPSPFESVYVLDGVIADASDPMAGNLFGPPARSFPLPLVAGIQERLRDLPPLRFVSNGNRVRRGKPLDGVKNEGVIISLGPIEAKKPHRVQVSNSLWCGGLCGQWLTYVLREDDGRWRITGTTGPRIIS